MTYLNRLAYASFVGGVIGSSVYAYNRAGELRKLPGWFGCVKPAALFAKTIGGTAFVATFMAPRYGMPITSALFLLMSLNALERVVPKQTEPKRDC